MITVHTVCRTTNRNKLLSTEYCCALEPRIQDRVTDSHSSAVEIMPSSGHPSPSSFEVAEDEPFPLNSRLQVGEAKVVIAMSSSKDNAFVHDLEERLKERSDQLEEVHMEAAIDAELITVVDGGGNPVVSGGGAKGETQEAIFDDYTNINAVANCLSPYVPAAADRIDAFCRWVDLTSADVLLDIGCGDGRVCVVASRLAGTFLLA